MKKHNTVIRGELNSGAEFSRDDKYRYALWRSWDRSLPQCTFIGLNPSTADEKDDDPTVRRCLRYARNWGCGSLAMLNLFAFRSTNPKLLRGVLDPIGRHNFEHVLDWAKANRYGPVVCAWGVNGGLHDAGPQLAYLLHRNRITLYALELTVAGHPVHPLYQKASLRPWVWLQDPRELQNVSWIRPASIAELDE